MKTILVTAALVFTSQLLVMLVFVCSVQGLNSGPSC